MDVEEASFEIASMSAVDCDRRAKELWKGRDDWARQAYRAITGIDLPQVLAYTDADGSLWEVTARVELRLARRGPERLDDGN